MGKLKKRAGRASDYARGKQLELFRMIWKNKVVTFSEVKDFLALETKQATRDQINRLMKKRMVEKCPVELALDPNAKYALQRLNAGKDCESESALHIKKLRGKQKQVFDHIVKHHRIPLHDVQVELDAHYMAAYSVIRRLVAKNLIEKLPTRFRVSTSGHKKVRGDLLELQGYNLEELQ